MPRSAFRFRHRFRVRYSEVDPQAVVFNARYLDYADLTVVEYWRAAGIRPDDRSWPEFHVARATIDYRRPIRSDELIDAFARVERFGTASMTIAIELHGADGEDLRAEIALVYVCVDLADGRSQPIPDAFRARLAALDRGDVTAETAAPRD
jgi:acyl-CoA thioester hydrolase